MIITTEYKPEYRDDVVALVQEFESEFFGEFGLEINHETFDQAIDAQKYSSFLLLNDGRVEGLLSGQLQHGFGLKGLMWQEVIWYVRKPYRKHGVKLLKAAMKSLKAQGVKAVIMAHLANELGSRIGKVYERYGFKPLEMHYIRRFD